jgi:hypothetical protein
MNQMDIEARLEELADLRDGWLNGGGRAPERAALLRLAHAFDEHYAPDLPSPSLYPTPEGGVQAVWSMGEWDVFLEITLPAMKAHYEALHPKTGESRELDLILDDDADWTTLNASLKAVQEGRA